MEWNWPTPPFWTKSTAACRGYGHCIFDFRSRDKRKINVLKIFRFSEEILPQTLFLITKQGQHFGNRFLFGNQPRIWIQRWLFWRSIYNTLEKWVKSHDYAPIYSQCCRKKNIKVCRAGRYIELAILTPPGWNLVQKCCVGPLQRFWHSFGLWRSPCGLFWQQKKNTKEVFLWEKKINYRCHKDIWWQDRFEDGFTDQRNSTLNGQSHIQTFYSPRLLLAVMAGMYAVYHGPKGLKYIAKLKVNSFRYTLPKVLKN